MTHLIVKWSKWPRQSSSNTSFDISVLHGQRADPIAGQRYATETFASREIVIFVMSLKIVKNAAQQRQQQQKEQQAEGAAAAAAAAEAGAVTRRAGSALE